MTYGLSVLAGGSKPAEDEQGAAEPAKEVEDEPAPKSKPAQTPDEQPSPKEEGPEKTEGQSGRKPMISFPQRRTESGQRISDLPLEEQKKYAACWL